MTDVVSLGAGELATAVACKHVTASLAIDGFLDVLARAEPYVQAWAFVDEPGARAAAELIDKFGPNDRSPLPLLGVPVGIKDVLTTKDAPTSYGAEVFRERGARIDAAAVARLRNAGAIILGKTVTCTFAGPDPARTRNPWHPDRTPGGSSAGSAAAVASGTVPAAIGTQTAGSVLRPAAFCGVVGFKPTFGRVPCDGVFPFAPSLDTIGCFTRTVGDAELVFHALAGSSTASAPVAASTRVSRATNLRVGRLNVADVLSGEVAAHAADVAGRLSGAGVEIIEARLPFDLEVLWAAQSLITHVEGAAVHSRLITEHPGAYGPGLRAIVELGHAVPGWSYAQALATRRLFVELIDEYFAGFDLLLLPTVGEAAPDRSTTGRHLLQSIATFLGLPAIAMPTGVDHAGLPLSTQLVGRAGRDELLLRHARSIESILDLTWYQPTAAEARHA